MTLVKALATFALLAIAAPAAAEVRLVMVEQAGCIWCTRWHAEVGDAYPVTEEGRAAPLLQVDIRAPLPEGVEFARPVVFTPTFVLVSGGREVGRIEGYPGEHFFWPVLGKMIAELPADQEKEPAS